MAELHDSRILRQYVRNIFVLCVVASGLCAISAADRSASSQYIRTDFTVDDGLPDNTVDAVTETDNGLLWVGTESGLASFDGRTFTPVHLRIPGAASPGAVNSLLVGADGDLWVGSDAGIVRIPKPDLNDSYFRGSTAYRLGNQQSDEVEVLFRARDGTIWAGTNHGLYRFDGQGFHCVLSSQYVSRINQALDGRLMLIASSGFVEYNGKEIIRHTGFGTQFGVRDDQIFDVFQDSDGKMWFCTFKGIRSIAEHRVSTLDPYLPGRAAAYRIYVGGNGSLWVATGMGVYRITGRQMWTPEPNLHARSFYASKDGDLWFGTNGGGLVHFHPRLVTMYTKADGLQSDIAMAVLPAHDGRLWVGCNCGLAEFDGMRFRTYAEKDGLANACVWALAEDQERNLWIGTYGGGLFRFSDGVFKQYTLEQGLASRIVLQITVAQDDSLWIATLDGLSHMQGSTIRNYTTANGLSSNRILDIHQDRSGNVWVATQAGIDRFVSDHFVPVLSTQAVDEMEADRFVEDSRGDLYTTDMPLGISQIRNGQLTPLDGTLTLMEMAEAPDHTLWFSSRIGVIRISEQKLANAGNTNIPLDYEVINRTDGLNTTEASVGTPNIAIDSNGKLWIATVKGLAMIDTLHLPITGRMPKVFVTDASIDNRRSSVGNGLILPPGIHHVELNLSAINLANPQKVRLQYRLEGVDSDWLDGTSSREAVYSNIPAGTHRLFVRVTDSIGHWSAPEDVYELTQQPHFYSMTLFRVSAALAAVLLILLAYFVRMRSVMRQTRIIIEQRQIERETVARELHDTLLQGVLSASIQLDLAEDQLAKDSPVRDLVQRVLATLRQVTGEGRTALRGLRFQDVENNDLAKAFQRIKQEFPHKDTIVFGVVALGAARVIRTEIRNEIYRIGREAILNAYVHSEAATIEVEIEYARTHLSLLVRDDGRGIDSSILQGGRDGHWGLAMRERSQRIGATLKLRSRVGAGTEIELMVPSYIAFENDSGNSTPRWRSWLGREGFNGSRGKARDKQNERRE